MANHLDSSELIVELDGARYENVPCVHQEQYKMGGNQYYIVGNPYIFTDKNPNIEYEDNGLPFCVYYTLSGVYGGTILLTDTAATAMFEMYEENAVINPLSTEFIPTTVPVIPAATVGQTVVVKAVDADGKPTEWEAADVGGSDVIVRETDDVVVTNEQYIEWAKNLIFPKVVRCINGMNYPNSCAKTIVNYQLEEKIFGDDTVSPALCILYTSCLGDTPRLTSELIQLTEEQATEINNAWKAVPTFAG